MARTRSSKPTRQTRPHLSISYVPHPSWRLASTYAATDQRIIDADEFWTRLGL